jgi:Cu-Zn family superoxide dismutase
MEYFSDIRRSFFPLVAIMSQRPDAAAVLIGSEAEPQISGVTQFYQTDSGVLVVAQIFGLPYTEGDCSDRVYGFHIHSGEACAGNENDPFSEAGTHFDPQNCSHPGHAGDLPPLFGNHGLAVCAVLTDRFTVREILHRTVVVHSDRDDFSTDPSGSAGTKIACGVIERTSGNTRWI